MQLTTKFKFCSAHFLPRYDGACRNLHGHDFWCKLYVAGNYNDETGMICDFKILKNIINNNVVSKLDHKNLNDIFENPTAENIVVWIFDALYQDLDAIELAIAKIELWESDNSSVVFSPYEEVIEMEMED
jgi:6-pyruvoyltetrahydropterin/6-carboxytetrahydropterin synthase